MSGDETKCWSKYGHNVAEKLLDYHMGHMRKKAVPPRFIEANKICLENTNPNFGMTMPNLA